MSAQNVVPRLQPTATANPFLRFVTVVDTMPTKFGPGLRKATREAAKTLRSPGQ